MPANSVCSSAAGPAAAAAGASATAAAAETPHFSSSIFDRSAASRTVSAERSSTIFARSAMFILHQNRDSPGNKFQFSPKSRRSEEHTSELQSLMRISYAVFFLKKKKKLLQIYNIHSKTPNNKHTNCLL